MAEPQIPQSTIQLLIVQLPSILTSLGVLLTVLLGFRNGRKADVANAKIDNVAVQVDGHATRAEARIYSLLSERDLMRDQASKSDQVAAVLAATQIRDGARRASDGAPLKVEVTNTPLEVTADRKSDG